MNLRNKSINPRNYQQDGRESQTTLHHVTKGIEAFPTGDRPVNHVYGAVVIKYPIFMLLK